VAPTTGERSTHFPAIEKKHGKPIAHWFSRLASLGEATYATQMALLQDSHGFSRAHANAVVMHHRGSTTSRRHATPEDLLASLDPAAARTARAIFRAVRARHKGLDLVVAWNQPILRSAAGYVLGVSTSKNHLTVNPFSVDALRAVEPRLAAAGVLKVNKNTFTVPIGWTPDADLLGRLVAVRLRELG